MANAMVDKKTLDPFIRSLMRKVIEYHLGNLDKQHDAYVMLSRLYTSAGVIRNELVAEKEDPLWESTIDPSIFRGHKPQVVEPVQITKQPSSKDSKSNDVANSETDVFRGVVIHPIRKEAKESKMWRLLAEPNPSQPYRLKTMADMSKKFKHRDNKNLKLDPCPGGGALHGSGRVDFRFKYAGPSGVGMLTAFGAYGGRVGISRVRIVDLQQAIYEVLHIRLEWEIPLEKGVPYFELSIY